LQELKEISQTDCNAKSKDKKVTQKEHISVQLSNSNAQGLDTLQPPEEYQDPQIYHEKTQQGSIRSCSTTSSAY
jgi:hypothetical protein